MTHEEIEKLEAGPELDVLVAEHVMGRKPCTKWHGGAGTLFVVHGNQGCDVGDRDGGEKCFDVNRVWLTRYSTDIKAAWKIVEHLSHGYRFTLYQLPSISSAGFGWHVEFARTIQRPDTVPMKDDRIGGPETAPLAICKAALRIFFR